MGDDRPPRRHPRYQDYVIRDGVLVGEFKELYEDFDDPWEQTERERFATEKEVGVHLLKRYGARRVVEVGCGLGGYAARLAAAGLEVRGLDIAPAAVARAREAHPEVDFQRGDLLDFDLLRSFRPDAVVMAEISWYVLEKLDRFRAFLVDEMPGALLLHLLHTYGPGVQVYGREYFTDLSGIMKRFDLDFLEWGTVGKPEYDGGQRTYFLARIPG